METKSKEIIWTEPAVQDLQGIYNYLAERSVLAANRIISLLTAAPESIARSGFTKSIAIDEYNPKYRRIIAGNYKLLFTVRKNIIVIHRIFDTRQNPEKLKKL